MNLTQELLASGLPREVHSQLGYRAVTREEAHQLTGYRYSGWVVPFNGPDGKPFTHNGRPFYRLKPNPAELKGDNPPRYLTAAGAGCRPYFSPLLPDGYLAKGKTLIITEGEKKTDALNCHGFPAIGISGVDCWQDRRSGHREHLPELDQIRWKNREVLICFDSDVTTKESVRDALMGLCHWLISQEARPKIILLPTEIDGSKNGADDFLMRHGAEAFSAMVRIARPCGDWSTKAYCKQFTWEPEPRPTHHKALMAWSVFKETHAYRPGFGYYAWKGTHWEPLSVRGSESINPAMHCWLDGMGFDQRSSSVMGSVRLELEARLHVEADQWDGGGLMAFTNGTLNTATNEFTLGHRRDDHLTFCLPFPFDRGATAPRWTEFLESTLGGDQELIRLMRAAIRWTLLPKDRDLPFPYELAFDIHGPRGGGKGTLCEVLQAVCGGLRGGAGQISSSSFGNPNALFGLIGKRAAIDPDASGRIGNVGTFNSVVSNEPVEVKRLYSDVGADRLGVVVWRFFNDQPGASGGGLEGMGRRIVPFRFDQPVANPDRQLKAKLTAEVAGIFWWAWSMPAEEMHDTLCNLGSIAATRQAATAAALERDPILRFLIETFPAGRSFITSRELYQQWVAWAKDAGHESGSETRFGREIRKVSAVESIRTKSTRGYGIEPMESFDVAAHIGIARPGDGLEPPNTEPVTDPSPNLSPSNPAPSLDSFPLVTGMTGSEEKKRSEQKREAEAKDAHRGGSFAVNASYLSPDHDIPCPAVDLGQSKPVTQPVPTRHPVTQPVTQPKPIAVDGEPGWRLPGAMPSGNGPNVMVLCTNPAGDSELIARRRITLLPPAQQAA